MKITLGKKVAIFIVVMAAVLSFTALIANNRVIKQMLDQHYKEHPWEKLSAAIGYVAYDPKTDKCVEDVLNRADAHMYEQKKKMKAERE